MAKRGAKYDKHCRKCGEVTQHYVSTGRCAPCRKVIASKFRGANKEKVAAEAQRYYRANKETSDARSKVYREANREKEAARSRAYCEANPEKEAARRKAYCEANPEKVRALCAKRRAAKRGANGSIGGEEWEFILEFYGKCLQCGTTENLSMDHVVPLDWGGDHSPENIQVLCKSHNSSKGAWRDTDYRTPGQIEEVTRLLEEQWLEA